MKVNPQFVRHYTQQKGYLAFVQSLCGKKVSFFSASGSFEMVTCPECEKALGAIQARGEKDD